MGSYNPKPTEEKKPCTVLIDRQPLTARFTLKERRMLGFTRALEIAHHSGKAKYVADDTLGPHYLLQESPYSGDPDAPLDEFMRWTNELISKISESLDEQKLDNSNQ